MDVRQLPGTNLRCSENKQNMTCTLITLSPAAVSYGSSCD